MVAALLLMVGPVVGPALRRTVVAAFADRPPWPITSPRDVVPAWLTGRAGRPAPDHLPADPPAVGRRAAVWLPLAAAVVVLLADSSALSTEVERIWLPFAVWLLVATAHLSAGHRRWWLAAQAATAPAVNHLLWTVS